MLIDAATKRMETMTKQVLPVGLLALVTLCTFGTAMAEIPEPDHIFWGKATYFGDDLGGGDEVSVTINDDPTVLASYRIGAQPELGSQFVLRVPLDSTGPRLPNTARVGDQARFYINGEPAGAKTISARGTVTRLDIDPNAAALRVIDIHDASIIEGDVGTQEMVFTLTLSESVEFDVSVNYTTQNQTATTANGDYVPENGVANFAAGDTEATLSITINGDTTIEPDETFLVNLTGAACSNQGGCTPPEIGDGHGTGTIVDDDTPPSISVSDVSVAESETTVQAIFRISLSHVWDQNVTVDFATADGSAEAGSDYLSASGVATIPLGALMTTVAVDVLADDEDEDNETFTLNISNPVNGTILDAQGVATILDDQSFLIYRGQQKNGVEGVLGLDGPWSVAVSPDGAHLYAVSETDTLILFNRDSLTGDLASVETLRDGVNGIDGLDGARDVAVSDDGLHVYVVSAVDDSIAAFARNNNDADPGYGSLTPIQVIVNGQAQNSLTVDGLVDATAVALSPDPDGDGPEAAGTHVYVVGKGENAVGADVGSIAVFRRDAATGQLTFLELEVDGVDDADDFGPAVEGILGASDVAISPDGAHLYVSGEQAGSLALFRRELDSSEPTLFGRLTYLESYSNGVGSPVVTGIEGASSVEITPDGSSVYVTGRGANGGIAHFARNADDGDAGFGELEFTGATGATTGNGLLDVVDCAVSRDGNYLFTAAFSSSTLAVFRVGAGGALEFIEVKQDGLGGVDGLSGAKRVTVSPDDRQVYAAGNFDDAVAIFVRDLDPPNDPTVFVSPSHTVDVWSGNPIITVQWSGAGDQGHSGLLGYSVLFDSNPVSQPNNVIDVVHGADPHSISSTPRSHGDSYYVHLKTCDNAGNCTSTLHLGPFKIDLTVPTNPTGVSSDSHVIGVPSNDTRITMRWSGAADVGSGVAGYGYVFTVVNPAVSNPPPVPAAVCTQVAAVAHTPGDIVVESSPLFNGRYFFHLCTTDAVGNWSAGITPVGPFVVQSSDAAAPTVELVNTVASMDDGQLSNGELVFPTVTQVLVSFSEAMFDSTDLGHPNTVRNVNNFTLFADGDNAGFETVTCGDVLGDDIEVFVDEVLYDDASETAALQLNSGFALPPDGYRLVICDELVDESGNNLDGDLNGTAGGEVVLGFEVGGLNLLLNPNFDVGDLSFWIDTPEGTPDVAPGLGVDAGGAFSSNSAHIDVIPASQGTTFSVSQCVPLTVSGFAFELAGWVWVAPDDPAFAPTATGTVKFYTGDECDVAETGSEQVTNTVVGDTDDFWLELKKYGSAPTDAASALVTFVVNRNATTPETVQAYFDDVYFGSQRVIVEVLFADDFESGGLDAWSAVAP